MSDAPTQEPTEEPAEDDVRRRFREALDRKNDARRSNENHEDSKGVGAAVNTTVTRREFRRKSG
jgi:Family of unknown function (DUF5302)